VLIYSIINDFNLVNNKRVFDDTRNHLEICYNLFFFFNGRIEKENKTRLNKIF